MGETSALKRTTSKPLDRAEDGRLMYYEQQVQRSEFYQGGWLDGLPVEEVRAMFEEILFYTGIGTGFEFPLPPAGLPGLLHAKYDSSEPAAELINIGIEYVSAIAFNERKSMHNRWREARDFIRKIEDRTEERVRKAIIDAQVREMADFEATPRSVYFIGAVSGPIKIGIAVNPQNRLKGLQTSHHEKLAILATCDGDPELEKAYHKRFAALRLNGEWFERSPELLAEIERINSSEQ